MKGFLDHNFLLHSKTSELLFHEFAKNMPIIDYHCHLSPKDIAQDKKYDTITEAWLYGDHYKWRAMRTNGVEESYCTGERNDWEKFEKWAETVPYTVRNPLFHWTHLELQRYFDINQLLNKDSAASIYQSCNEQLQSNTHTVRSLLRKMNVQLVCTTDDPVDSLEYHNQLRNEGFDISILPAFRPDNAMNVANPLQYNAYLEKLELASGVSISTFQDFLTAMKNRHDFFASMGCRVSDHGLEEIYADQFSSTEIVTIFNDIRNKKELTVEQQRKFKSALLIQFAEWDYEKGWIQQFHLGAMRNNNSRKMKELGPDTGWDSIGDYSYGKSLSRFLDILDSNNTLTKTVLYNLNPVDNELMATMIGNFNDGSIEGKVQWGSAWWFLDQKDGMTKQLNALSNMSLLSKFIGMLTDSRSFLSFPRHEYFRRILCNLFGEEIEKGELPNDINWIGKIIQDICYNNNQKYFNWQLKTAVSKND